MSELTNLSVEEKKLLANAVKTTTYFVDALQEQDYESANLELNELKFVVKRLAKMQEKREKKEQLEQLVSELKERGINIDFAKRASFLTTHAKNAVEDNQNNIDIDKKRQQA